MTISVGLALIKNSLHMSKMLEKENGNVILRVILFMGDKIAKGELLYALLW